jgi:hypothetical protein
MRITRQCAALRPAEDAIAVASGRVIATIAQEARQKLEKIRREARHST